MKAILEISALVLAIVNGLMLFRSYFRDRAVLKVSAIHPEVYQWWFRLPGSEYQGQTTRSYGFLLYIGIANKGLRKVQLEKWRLIIRSASNKKIELKPMSIPEPSWENEVFTKYFPVLGQKGLMFGGATMVDAGCSISGMAYYIYECFGDKLFDPLIVNDTIRGSFEVNDVFGKKEKCKIIFSYKKLEYVQTIFKDIEKIG